MRDAKGIVTARNVQAFSRHVLICEARIAASPKMAGWLSISISCPFLIAITSPVWQRQSCKMRASIKLDCPALSATLAAEPLPVLTSN